MGALVALCTMAHLDYPCLQSSQSRFQGSSL